MQRIDDRTVFSRPQLLSHGPHAQVFRYQAKVPQAGKRTHPIDCILKFFPLSSKIPYDKEITVYNHLLRSKTPARFPKPLGYDEWPPTKYSKLVGKRTEPLLKNEPDSKIFVLMLEYIADSMPLSKVENVSLAIVQEALSSLSSLHALRILHGDISSSNVLVVEHEHEVQTIWVDFSSSWTGASSKQKAWEMDKAAEHFGQLVHSTITFLIQKAGIEKATILPKASIFTVQRESSVDSSVGELESLPCLSDDVKFYDWTFICEGTHAEIYRATDVESGVQCCIKIFRKGWMTPFNLEKTAYEALQHAKVKDYVPHIYAYTHGRLSDLGFPGSINDEDIYYGLVMEWLDGAQQISGQNVTLSTACELVKGLSEIHRAGILHYDLYRRNIMVIPEKERGVWIDFSCAHMNEEYAQPDEMTSAVAIILENVMSLLGFLIRIARGKRKTSGRTANGPCLRFVHITRAKNFWLFIFPASISGGCRMDSGANSNAG